MTPPPGEPTLEISALDSTTTYPNGPLVHLTATVTFEGEEPADVTTDAVWSSSSNAAAIGEPGEVYPLAGGTPTITATYQGVTATLDLSILATSGIVVATDNGFGPHLIAFEPTADGPATAVRWFRNLFLNFLHTVQIVGDEMFVATESKIAVFPADAGATASPAVAVMPLREMQGPETLIDDDMTGMWVRGAEIFSAVRGQILVHPIEGNGKQPPLRVISPSTPRNFSRIQAVGNELFVSTFDGRIEVFDASVSGVAAPLRSIAGTATELASITGFSVANGEIFVTSREDGRIRVFPATATGDVAPVRILSTSPPTSSEFVRALSVVENELYVLDLLKNEFLVFDASADGMVDPIRRVTSIVGITGGTGGNVVAIHAR
jgi:hypothetical protein